MFSELVDLSERYNHENCTSSEAAKTACANEFGKKVADRTAEIKKYMKEEQPKLLNQITDEYEASKGVINEAELNEAIENMKSQMRVINQNLTLCFRSVLNDPTFQFFNDESKYSFE